MHFIPKNHKIKAFRIGKDSLEMTHWVLERSPESNASKKKFRISYDQLH